jgi:hypothetical protein
VHGTVIDHVDSLLRHLLLTRIVDLVDENHVRFQPPDKDFRSFISNLQGPILNVYLLDLHENRTLYSNDRTRVPSAGAIRVLPAPRRIECHYLITAWSPSPATAAFDPTTSEHAVLYRVARALMNAEPFVPRQLFAPDPLPLNFPAEVADSELPTAVLWEDFPKYAEFWGTMGPGSAWRPGVHFRITVPVVQLEIELGPPVLNAAVNYGTTSAGSLGTLIEIGGRLVDGGVPQADGSPSPLAAGWVELLNANSERLQWISTEQSGRFSIRRLRPGSYRIRGQGVGLSPIERQVNVPSETGEYDLQY